MDAARERDRRSAVLEKLPEMDALSWFAMGISEEAVVVDENREPCRAERLGVAGQTVVAGEGEPVGHDHTGKSAGNRGRTVQPRGAPGVAGREP